MFFLFKLAIVTSGNCIMTRGGVFDEILPEPEGNPDGRAQGISRGLRQYFIVYPDSSISRIDSVSFQYFLVLTSIGLCLGSFKSSLGNTLCLKGNIATVIFQYSIVR